MPGSADQLGAYRIVRQIGRGGQATVYLAEDTRLHRQVALKVVDRGLAADPTALERFKREAEITSRLDDPGICAIYETGEDHGMLWIAMRYVDGESLASKVSTARLQGETTLITIPELSGRDEPRTPAPSSDPASGPGTWAEISRVLDVFEKAARTLHAAHEVGVVHRDIKPGNVMVTKDGTPVILDFGLAQELEGDQSSLTMTGTLMGTPAYMSPEQIAAQRIRLDRRTDVYSLGVSLFECLTLKRPFEEPTRERTYQAILTKSPPDVRALNAAVPRDLKVVVETALEKDRDRRYQTALDLAEDLRRVRAREPILARPVGPLVRLQRWAQRNPALAIAVGGIFGLLAAGLVLALFLLAQRDLALAAVTRERNEKQAALSGKSAALADYDRLGDASRLEKLAAEAEDLWPAEPAKVPALRGWVERASRLEERLAGHRAVLERLRRQGRAVAPESRDAQSRPADTRPAAWEFDSAADQFRHDTTARLVASLEAFLDPDPHAGLLAGVRRRLAFAEGVERETLGEHAARWAAAVRSIADESECPKYRGLKIAPQLGLIPIAKDAASGLWEFAHLQTAEPGADPVPKRGSDGRLVVAESTGIVFVLLPGGTFRMGAVKPVDDASPSEPNADPEATQSEGPVTEIALQPFFASKYEMTQGQWLRLVGKNPSAYSPGQLSGGKAIDLRNPVEQVSWDDCELWLPRIGLLLPTEAQWEYAARGGTTTPRWTGAGVEGLAKAANLADAFCKKNGGPPSWNYEEWDDGYAAHAAVGTFAPNPFGLHDVLGNVWEWCCDAHGPYDVAPRPGDGLRTHVDPYHWVNRGGAFNDTSTLARSAARGAFNADTRIPLIGVRPIRQLTASHR